MKTKNSKGKMSHGANRKPMSPEMLKLWEKYQAERKSAPTQDSDRLKKSIIEFK